MANGHGGYRKPNNPAPVSGPGAHSRRTDGNFQSISTVPGQAYGDAGQQKADQKLAPMGGQTPLPSAPPADTSQPQLNHPTPYGGGDFNAPSSRPGEPVTSGVPIGPGNSIPVMRPAPRPTGALTNMLTQLSPSDNTGVLAQLLEMAQTRGV